MERKRQRPRVAPQAKRLCPLTLVITLTVTMAWPEDCARTTSLPSVWVGNLGSTNSGCTLLIHEVRCWRSDEARGLYSRIFRL